MFAQIFSGDIMEVDDEENIVLTPRSKSANSTILIIERCIKHAAEPNGENNVHIAGGEHQGLVVNKNAANECETSTKADISLEFKVYLVNSQSGIHTQESRILKFWFKPVVEAIQQSTIAQLMFKDLVSPNEFPRDYVGFIKKIMKLMQNPYDTIKKVEIELKQFEEIENIPNRPNSSDESSQDRSFELTERRLLDAVESSYPNPVTIRELAIRYSWEEESVEYYFFELQRKGLIKELDHGVFTRVVHGDDDVQIVKRMPTITSAKQPTIAIITAQYCEKVAIDCLIENKETYVRYTTIGDSDDCSNNEPDNGRITEKTIFITRFGESNIYTLGNIGQRRVVCTKLPTVGHTREAIIAAGNTTTRLLGTFQKVDFVILVGVGGGIPHYTDYKKHVRLGDVVISHAVDDKKYIYTYCREAKYDPENMIYDFETKEYYPTNPLLQEISSKLKSQWESKPECSPWIHFLNEGQELLKQELGQDFSRPSKDSDKLYMRIGEGTIIEVSHPVPVDGVNKLEGIPRIHLGPIAAGRAVSKNEQLRQTFALQSSALAFDSEFDSVIESVIGSCRESFVVIRGIADYRDGTKRSEWQHFASLTAAAVVKSIILAMEQ